MPHRLRGFTLIEALVALLVTGVLLGVAVPAWSGALEAAHATSARAMLLESLTHSISHAALTGSEVVLCPGDADGCRNSIDWSGGWIAFADIDGNRRRDANETLLSHQPALTGRVHLRSTLGRTRLVFQPNGGNAGSNVTFTLCDGRGAARAATLVLANDGRLRGGTPTASAAQACLVAMN
jgi:type IV fimbrial biogenesis protein FimT